MNYSQIYKVFLDEAKGENAIKEQLSVLLASSIDLSERKQNGEVR